MSEAQKIIARIEKGNLSPIYLLSGEEPYFIDMISDHIEQNVLSASEKEFNQSILYGRDVSVEQVIASAKRFPMMAEHQVIILKEAQDLSKEFEKFDSYFQSPQPS